MSTISPVHPEVIDARPRREFSLTTILIAINVAVFVGMTLSGVSIVDPTRGQLVRWGANWGPLSLGAQPWRILTSNYVHVGIIHILLNMWCLWSLGKLADRLFDPWSYFLVYTVCGIAGSVASLWWHPAVVGAGASGAIFGLAGAVLAVLYLGKLPIPRAALQPTIRSLVAFVGYNLFFGLRPGVDNSAHLGGLAAGLCLGAVMARFAANRDELRPALRTACIVLAGLLTACVFAVRKDAVRIDAADTDPDALPNGITAIKNKQPDEAIRNLRMAVKQDPKQATLQYLLGAEYLEAQRPNDALEAFQEALRLKPDYADAQTGIGMAYSAMGRQQDAEAAFARAAKMGSSGGR